MSKMELVRSQMMAAMKLKDKVRKDALSLLLAALKAKYIDKRADLTEEEENTIILKEIKQAQETLDATPADRTELIEECKARIAVYNEFAPQMMDEAQIKQIITELLGEMGIAAPTAKDKGLLMKQLMPKVKGKADGALVNRIVGEMLV